MSETSLPPEILPATLASIEHELRNARKHFPKAPDPRYLRHLAHDAVNYPSTSASELAMQYIRLAVVAIRILEEGAPGFDPPKAFKREV